MLKNPLYDLVVIAICVILCFLLIVAIDYLVSHVPHLGMVSRQDVEQYQG